VIGDGDRLPGDKVWATARRARGRRWWASGIRRTPSDHREAGPDRPGVSVCNVRTSCATTRRCFLASTRTALAAVAVHTSYGPAAADDGPRPRGRKLRRNALTATAPPAAPGSCRSPPGSPAPPDTATCGSSRRAQVRRLRRLLRRLLGPDRRYPVSTAPDAAPGVYTAYVGWPDGRAVVKTYQFMADGDAPAPVLGVSPAAARSGDRLTISAGAGCGGTPRPPRTSMCRSTTRGSAVIRSWRRRPRSRPAACGAGLGGAARGIRRGRLGCDRHLPGRSARLAGPVVHAYGEMAVAAIGG